MYYSIDIEIEYNKYKRMIIKKSIAKNDCCINKWFDGPL